MDPRAGRGPGYLSVAGTLSRECACPLPSRYSDSQRKVPSSTSLLTVAARAAA